MCDKSKRISGSAVKDMKVSQDRVWCQQVTSTGTLESKRQTALLATEHSTTLPEVEGTLACARNGAWRRCKRRKWKEQATIISHSSLSFSQPELTSLLQYLSPLLDPLLLSRASSRGRACYVKVAGGVFSE